MPQLPNGGRLVKTHKIAVFREKLRLGKIPKMLICFKGEKNQPPKGLMVRLAVLPFPF